MLFPGVPTTATVRSNGVSRKAFVGRLKNTGGVMAWKMPKLPRTTSRLAMPCGL